MDSIFEAPSTWNDIRSQLGRLLQKPGQDRLFAGKMTLLAAQISQLIDQNTDGAIFSIMQFDRSDYSVTHSLQSAVICDIYGTVLNWSIPERLSAIGAALTMNIAMLSLQQHLLQRDEPPTKEQQQAIRMHPVRGRELLEKLGLYDERWLRIVAEHHESVDGKGYPTGMTTPSDIAAALNLCDRYCAKISRRRYRDALPPEWAIHELRQMSSGGAREAVDLIVQAVGLYPPGTFVELANGETAVVASRAGVQETPRVFAVRDVHGAELDPIPRDATRPEFAIQGTAKQISTSTSATWPKLMVPGLN